MFICVHLRLKKMNHQGTKDTKNITILSSRAKSRDLKLTDSDKIPPLLIVGRNDDLKNSEPSRNKIGSITYV